MNDLATTSQSDLSIGTAATIMNPAALQALVAFSELMAKSGVTVPDHLKGKPADCMAVAMQAAQWGMNPFAVAQKTHIVSGRLGYEAQLVNAVIQASGAIVGSPHYEHDGDGNKLQTRVGCVLRGQHEITWGEWLCIADVQVKNSPLWKTNPRQQMGYLQLKNWARLYTPGAILGVYTPDELEVLDTPPRDMGEAEVVDRGPRRRSAALPPAPAPAAATIDNETGEVSAPAPAPTPKAQAPAPASSAASGGISGGQVNYLRNKIKSAGVAEQVFLDRYQVAGLELLTVAQFDEVKAELLQVV
jgi:hypothetical protein